MALLWFIAGATETETGPVLAPVGIVIVIEVSDQAVTVALVLPIHATLLPCVEPKPAPEMTTDVPTGPVVVERLATTAEGVTSVVTERLSNVAVAVEL